MKDKVKFFMAGRHKHNCQAIEKQPLKPWLQGHLAFSKPHTNAGLLLSQSTSFLIYLS
jgi:hypothetical protein